MDSLSELVRYAEGSGDSTMYWTLLVLAADRELINIAAESWGHTLWLQDLSGFVSGTANVHTNGPREEDRSAYLQEAERVLRERGWADADVAARVFAAHGKCLGPRGDFARIEARAENARARCGRSALVQGDLH